MLPSRVRGGRGRGRSAASMANAVGTDPHDAVFAPGRRRVVPGRPGADGSCRTTAPSVVAADDLLLRTIVPKTGQVTHCRLSGFSSPRACLCSTPVCVRSAVAPFAEHDRRNKAGAAQPSSAMTRLAGHRRYKSATGPVFGEVSRNCDKCPVVHVGKIGSGGELHPINAAWRQKESWHFESLPRCIAQVSLCQTGCRSDCGVIALHSVVAWNDRVRCLDKEHSFQIRTGAASQYL